MDQTIHNAITYSLSDPPVSCFKWITTNFQSCLREGNWARCRISHGVHKVYSVVVVVVVVVFVVVVVVVVVVFLNYINWMNCWAFICIVSVFEWCLNFRINSLIKLLVLLIHNIHYLFRLRLLSNFRLILCKKLFHWPIVGPCWQTLGWCWHWGEWPIIRTLLGFKWAHTTFSEGRTDYRQQCKGYRRRWGGGRMQYTQLMGTQDVMDLGNYTMLW